MKEEKVCVGLINPKSPENVGSVMRAAGNFGVDSILYTGERYSIASKLGPYSVYTSRKVGQNIPLIKAINMIDELPEGLKLVCIEFAEDAIPLPEYQHPDCAIYIFGPEDGSISQKLIDKADAVVYVPTQGCMNLAASVNVVLYDRSAKSAKQQRGNDLIRQNRDINNRLRVKS